MVRIPAAMARVGFAGLSGSGPFKDPNMRPILRPPDHLFNRRVTVDIGNDGMAPFVFFSAGGTAQAVIGPTGGGDLWSLDQCAVSTSVGQFDPSTCVVFVGPLPLPQYQAAPTLAGGGTQFGMGGLSVPFGWFVYAQWSGGTTGAQAILRVTGSKTVLSN